MVVPAFVYLTLQWGKPSAVGWGIPMATDIAFVVGFLALFGPRVPHSLKILLLTLAIVDDIGATLVIGLVYSTNLSAAALAVGLAGFGLIVFFQWIGVRRVPIYVIVSVFIWVAFVKSGVHPTIAGIALGLLTPARTRIGDRPPINVVSDLFRRIGGAGNKPSVDRPPQPSSPLERIERSLHPWVAFVIMPVFALANAGVEVNIGSLGESLTLAVAAGLIVGKPIGIVLFCWLSVRTGLARMPTEITTRILIGAGCLAGIGFTMSLFIASLALQAASLEAAKLGILVGSTVSAILGCALLHRSLPQRVLDTP
jgi:NhaA family Na+:H+ antiporter